MKELKLFALGIFICTSMNLVGQIKMNTLGNVGIKTEPSSTSSYSLNVGGEIQTNDIISWGGVETWGYNTLGSDTEIVGDLYLYGDIYNWSDKTLKKDIADVKSYLLYNKFLQLNARNFKYKTDDELDGIFDKKKESKKHKPYLPEGERYGFIAQEVKEIFPEFVKIDSVTGLLRINYMSFIPILIDVVQTQQELIDSLQNQMAFMYVNCCSEKNNSHKSATSSNNENGNSYVENFTEALLKQNAPNPFNISTKIGFYLPESITNAIMYIYDMSGKPIANYPIYERGNAQLTIQGSELSAGMYHYSLVADSRIVDTKQMILTD